MKNLLTAIVAFLISSFFCNVFAQMPPKQGIIPPADFYDFQKILRSDYPNGYYAEKFREREQIREQIENGILPKTALAADSIKAINLMGEYSNFSGFYSQQQFQEKLFDGPNPTGTLNEFYSEISYNQLYFTGDSKGWFTLPRTFEDYVGSNQGRSVTGGPRFVWELIQAADPTVNFADYIQYYDGSGKPHIGFISVVHAGAGAEAGANNIWSHKWTFRVYMNQPYVTNDVDPQSGYNVIIDGDYAIMPERNGGSNSSGTIIEIGVFAHEYGHIFGLPDLYDTDNSSEGLGNWCLMAGGAWGGNGSTPQTPVHMSAWCKKKLGWVTPVNITSYQMGLVVPNAEENPVVYRMWKDGTVGSQYFLIENRQKIKFDKNLYSPGFLIYHVDENIQNNQNENHYMVDVEQADGLRDLNNGQNRGDARDPFPGATNNTEFDWDTNPNSKDYSLQNTFVSVRNIHRDNLNMVGDFGLGLRPGAFAYVIPKSINFGEVETGTNSRIDSVKIINYGNQDIVFSDIANNFEEFSFESDVTFPIILHSLDSVKLHFRFSPTDSGSFSVVYPVTSNDSGFVGITLSGSAYDVAEAIPNGYYASAGSGSNGAILSFNPITGAGTSLGLSGVTGVSSITVNPKNGKLFALLSSTVYTQVLKISAADGAAHSVFTTSNPILTAIAFDTSGTMYGITRDGELFNIDLNNNSTTFIVDAVGSYLSMAFNPLTNELWATSRAVQQPNRDAILKVNFLTGDTIIVGHTGLGKQTNAIVFNSSLELFGVIGGVNEENSLININTSTGTGSVIGLTGFKNVLGLAYNPSLTSVDEDLNTLIIPTVYELEQNYPNPFNPNTTIRYQIPQDGFVTLKIYDILGSEIATLVNEEKTAGRYEVNFNASSLSSGVYIYKIQSGSFINSKKMLLLK